MQRCVYMCDCVSVTMYVSVYGVCVCGRGQRTTLAVPVYRIFYSFGPVYPREHTQMY